eukprot:11164897-Alexandrium_andersonii.AAC.1
MDYCWCVQDYSVLRGVVCLCTFMLVLFLTEGCSLLLGLMLKSLLADGSHRAGVGHVTELRWIKH